MIAMMAFVLAGCKTVDLRTSTIKEASTTKEELEKQGRALLQESVIAMGYDKLDSLDTYEAVVNFKWKFPWTLMPMNAFPGSGRSGKKSQKFEFAPLTFDGRITYLDGKKKGNIYGLQGFRSYQIPDGNELEFKTDKRRAWGLAAWHYLLESPYRLLNKAQIIRYAGVEEMDGIFYERVFATWGSEEANSEHDQFVLYINPTTKHVDLAHITIREFFLPMPKGMAHGVARYAKRQETSAGILFPESMILQIMNPKKEKKYVYRVNLTEYKFNTFSSEKLYPDSNLPRYQDEKPVSLE